MITKRIYIALLLTLTFLFTTVTDASAQAKVTVVNDTTEYPIYFRRAYSSIDLGFRGNGATIDSIEAMLRRCDTDTALTLRGLSVTGAASPEGGSSYNKNLANRRATRLRDFLAGRLGIDPTAITINSVGVDWKGLADYLRASDKPYRDRVIEIIETTPEWVVEKGIVTDSRKARLMRLDRGTVWNDMDATIFPDLRYSLSVLAHTERIITIPEPVGVRESTPNVVTSDTVVMHTPIVPPDTVRARESTPDPVATPDTIAREKKPFYMALKTNMLYDALAVPNIGIEFYLGRDWSLDADWMYGWWSNDARHRYWRIYGGDIEARHWFGSKARQKPLQGHHIGIYGQILTYDFELGGKGIMGGEPGGTLWDRMHWGVGVDYGFSLPVGRRINIDFTIGVGYQGGKYYEYIPLDGHYVWQRTARRRWVGPTKAEISLVWLLGRGNYNDKKGGRR